MSDEQDKEQKTEDPTQKRLEDAIKKGNVPFSRELVSFAMLTMLAVTIAAFAPVMLSSAKTLMMPFLTDADSLPADLAGLGKVMRKVTLGALLVIAAPLLGAMIAAIGASVIQNGLLLTSEPIMPKFERISPVAGFGRLFSMRSIVEFLKGIIKIVVVGLVAFLAIYPELRHITQLPDSTTEAMLVYLSMLAVRMTLGVAVAMFFIALADLLYQRYQFTKNLRMTKQEVKEEYKQSEGDPHIKQRLRRLRMERARQRMMQAVPEADVVITNPTHFAVALKYDGKTMKAPSVIAKGQELVALRIRELAKEHEVPIVENPPLARALFDAAEIGQEIPVTHYEAVAKIISYVYKLKGRKYEP